MPWILLHQTWQMNLLWLMNPLSTRAEMTCIPLHKTWQMNLFWPMNLPPVPEQRWLAYHYTKPGRVTYFGQWIPQYQSRDDLHTTTQNLADEPTLVNEPPSSRAEMTCIPLHKTWQMNLLWPMNPTSTRAEMTCIPLHKTWHMNLLWPMDHLVPEQRWLAYHYTKLGRWTYFGQWTPQYQCRDDLHTTTQNLADEPTLAEPNGQGLRAVAFTISEIPHSIFSKHIFA